MTHSRAAIFAAVAFFVGGQNGHPTIDAKQFLVFFVTFSSECCAKRRHVHLFRDSRK
jgi:hypothetical protein